MTIIQPEKTNNKINFLISVLMLILIISAVWGVFLYNQLVDYRHETDNFKKVIQAAEVESAELKNTLYQMIDIKNLESLVSSSSLVVEKNPLYIKQQEVMAFSEFQAR